MLRSPETVNWIIYLENKDIPTVKLTMELIIIKHYNANVM